MLGRNLTPTVGKEARAKSLLACVLVMEEVELVLDLLGGVPDVQLSALCLLDGDRERAAALSLRLSVPVDTRWDAFLATCDAGLIVVSNDRRLISRELAFAIIELALDGVAVCTLTRFVTAPDQASRPVPDPQVVDHLLEVVEADSPGRRIKRVLDVALASIGLMLLAPLLCFIGIAIKLDSPGSALLVQERLGRWRRPFPCLKFRSMCEDAERDTGPVWAAANDPRITRIGRFLRRSRIDELPQLINVVRGEMSLVGTRPIRRYFAEQLADLVPFYNLRFLEKPGLTGWAQVKYRYPVSIIEQTEKFLFDYYYIRNRSIALDLYIMLKTVSVIIRMKGT